MIFNANLKPNNHMFEKKNLINEATKAAKIEQPNAMGATAHGLLFGYSNQ